MDQSLPFATKTALIRYHEIGFLVGLLVLVSFILGIFYFGLSSLSATDTQPEIQNQTQFLRPFNPLG